MTVDAIARERIDDDRRRIGELEDWRDVVDTWRSRVEVKLGRWALLITMAGVLLQVTVAAYIVHEVNSVHVTPPAGSAR